jgi:polysaccharide biosynthesis/export protein
VCVTSLNLASLGFLEANFVVRSVLAPYRFEIGENLMISGRLQAFSASAFFFSICVAIGVFVIAPVTANAQSGSANSLEDLVKQIEGLGKAGEGFIGSGKLVSPVDAARDAAVKGVVRSPFSQKENTQFPELNTRFTAEELFLIERYCRGEAKEEEHQVLRVMPEFSQVERDYCQRVSDRVLQIGYHVFDGAVTPELLVNGSIQEDYVLGIGDEIVITFDGKRSDSLEINIDREGRIAHRSIGRLPAAGKTIREFRRDLKRHTESTHIGTDVFISMGAVRQIVVRVTGEVRKPGLHRSTGLSTLFDALSLAGGIKKTGSLRRVQIQRGDTIFWLDVYELLFPRFGGQNAVLRDGDHILVPPLGHTIAVAGDVKRAGIFELAEGQTTITAREALQLAGGFIRPKGNSLVKHSFDATGRENFTSLTDGNAVIEDGDILFIKRRNKATVGTVSLIGHVTNPGTKSIASFPTVRTLLLADNNFNSNPYLLLGALETTDPSTFSRRYFPLNLQEIVDGKKDYSLRENDRLIVFSHDEIRYLSSDDVRMTIAGISDPIVELEAQSDSSSSRDNSESLASKLVKSVKIDADASSIFSDQTRKGGSKSTNSKRSSGQIPAIKDSIRYSCLGLRSLATILQFTRSGRFASVVQALGGAASTKSVNPRECPQIFDASPDLLPFVLEHSVAVNGEVRTPGAYPVINGTSVASLLAAVGGMTLDADTSRVEVSRFGGGKVVRQNIDFTKTQLNEVNVGPGDLVRFNPMFKARDTGPVLLSGEFARPGLYDIRRGERLSEVIERAGGITDQAFPYGAVFTRERVRIAQRAAFKRAARELKSTAMYAAGKEGANASALIALQDLTDEISNTESVGRVVIEADPTALQVRPELDTVLEPGDKIYMPKRPNSVLVIGDILNPGALQFVAGTKVDQYVQQAGGLQISADEDRMFLVYPNGVAQPVSVSVWNYNPVRVPPGSTVVVPKDPVPVNIFDFAKDMTALLSQMAITAASLAVISNN